MLIGRELSYIPYYSFTLYREFGQWVRNSNQKSPSPIIHLKVFVKRKIAIAIDIYGRKHKLVYLNGVTNHCLKEFFAF